MPAKGLRRHLEVNVLSVYRLTQLVAEGMIDAGGGAIINISSDAAHRPGPGPYADPSEALLLAYGTSKAALQTMTQYLACDLLPHGIAVNALLPSAPIDTPGLRATAGEQLETVPIEGFAEAAVRLALATTESFTGRVAFHDDVLHPERSPKGWIGS
jgi:NAD(P)-dependent dehydrogenase (short-subunit alcohol dehydrogenase family)